MNPEPFVLMGIAIGLFLGWVWRLWRQSRSFAKNATSGRTSEIEELRQQTALLIEENGVLKTIASRAEHRLAALESIVTDPSDRTAREIDRLR